MAKRPSSKEVLNIIKEWIIDPYVYRIEDINEGLKCDDMEIMEFINTPIGHNNLATKSHPQAYYTSCLLWFYYLKVEWNSRNWWMSGLHD